MGNTLINKLETIVSFKVKGSAKAVRDAKNFFKKVSSMAKSSKLVVNANNKATKSQDKLNRSVKKTTNAYGTYNAQAKKVISSQAKINRAVKQGTKAVATNQKKVASWSKQVGNIRGQTTGWQRAVGKLRNQILLVTFALGGMIATLKKAVQASIEKQNALLGLTAVAAKFNITMERSVEVATELTETGLLSVKDAAAGLKNLLSTGLGMEESNRLMIIGGEAAAFNRQGTLSYGEALVGFTQGLKNMNCVLYNTKIYDPVRRETKTIEEWHDEGIVPNVLSVNRQTGEMEVIQAEYLHYNGVNQVFEIELENGSKIEATANHRFLTQDGFKFLEDLDLENDVLYYVNEKLVDKELVDSGVDKYVDIGVHNGYIESNKHNQEEICKDSKNAKIVVKNSQSTLTQENGEGLATVKDVGLEQSMRGIDDQVKCLANGLKLNVTSAEMILSQLNDMSKSDMDYFVQKYADQKIMDEDTLAKIVQDIVEELKKNVRSVKKSSLLLRDKKKEEQNIVPENAPQTGILKNTAEKIILPIKMEEAAGMQVEETINNGEKLYLNAQGYDVVNAIELAKVLITRIIFSYKKDFHSGEQNSQMVSPFVRNVTEKYTKEATIQLKNSSACLPMPLKIVKISLREMGDTYDLSVAPNFNFVGNCIIQANSIMVDNVGITKNLSIMQKEFAASIGTTIGKLTEAEKKIANYVGSLKEGSVFIGNALKLTETFSGALSKFKVLIFDVSAAFGDTLRPILKTVTSNIANIIEKWKDWFKVTENQQRLTEFVTSELKGFIDTLTKIGKTVLGLTTFFKNLTDAIGISKSSMFGIIAVLLVLHKQIKIIALTSTKLVSTIIVASKVVKTNTAMLHLQTSAITTLTKAQIVFSKVTVFLTASLKAFLITLRTIAIQLSIAIALYILIDKVITKLVGKSNDLTKTVEDKIVWDRKEISLITTKIDKLNELRESTERLTRERKIALEQTKAEIVFEVSRANAALTRQRQGRGGGIFQVAGGEVNINKLQTKSLEELHEIRKKLLDQRAIFFQTEKVFNDLQSLSNDAINKNNELIIKKSEAIVDAEAAIEKERTKGRGISASYIKTQEDLIKIKLSEIDALVLANQEFRKEPKAVTEAKLAIEEYGDAITGLDGKIAVMTSNAEDNVNKLSDAYTTLLNKLREFRIAVELAYAPEPTTAFDKALKKHNDKFNQLEKTARLLQDQITKLGAGGEGVTELQKQLNEVNFAKALLAAFKKPENNIDFVLEDLGNRLRDSAKKFRSAEVLANVFTGSDAIAFQRKKLNVMADANIEAVLAFFEKARELKGAEEQLGLWGLDEDTILTAIIRSTELKDDLLRIQQKYYDQLGKQRRDDLERAKTIENSAMRLRADKMEELRLNHIVEFGYEKAKEALAKHTEKAIFDITLSFLRKGANAEKAFAELKKNLVWEVLAVTLSSIAQTIEIRAGAAALLGNLFQATKLFAFAGLVKGLAGAASSHVSPITEATTTDALIGTENVSTNTRQPIGGLDLGASFAPARSPQPNITFNMPNAVFLTEDTPKELSDAITRTVNDKLETGEIIVAGA